jgi:hypothetical protein
MSHNRCPTLIVGRSYFGGVNMRALMPFDTEKERKPLKVWEMSFSWRQTAYMVVSGVIFMELCQYTYNGSVPFLVTILVFFLCSLVLIPGIVFSFIRHSSSGLFFDKYLLYYLRFKKKESGIWRRF